MTMGKLLYIKASPRDRSHSVAVADAFVEAYRGRHPRDEVETLDLFEMDLPPFDGFIIQAKYNIMHGLDHSAEQREAWRVVESLIGQFASADKYVLAVPMWNFGISYRLKQYIDIIVQPTYTFRWSAEEGYVGLLTDRRVLAVYARGGAYGPDSGAQTLDFQKPYLEMILGFIGLTDVQSIVIEPTEGVSPEVKQRNRQEAIERAVAISETF